MKNTILSEKDVNLIGRAILKYGRILFISDLMTIFREGYSATAAHNRISRLVNAGWLRRIRRGLFLIIDSLSARSYADVSPIAIANALVRDSYVSLSYALNYHHLFDQYGRTVVSVTAGKGRGYAFDGYRFKFSKVKKGMYFGFSEEMENGRIIRIAEAEKALIDYLYLDQSFGSASLVFERLRDSHQDLDLGKLQRYAVRSGITVQRKVGFLLDQLHLDADTVHQAVRANRGISRFTASSRRFNAKWRLYYDPRITG